MNHQETIFTQFGEILTGIVENGYMKIAVGALLSLFGELCGVENYSLLFYLFVLIVIDLLTGVWASVKAGYPVESRKALKTATKTIVYLLFFVSAHMTSHLIPKSDFIVVGVLAFLALTEFLSVAENMAKLGYSLPQKLLNQLGEKKKDPTHYGTGNKKK